MRGLIRGTWRDSGREVFFFFFWYISHDVRFLFRQLVQGFPSESTSHRTLRRWQFVHDCFAVPMSVTNVHVQSKVKLRLHTRPCNRVIHGSIGKRHNKVGAAQLIDNRACARCDYIVNLVSPVCVPCKSRSGLFGGSGRMRGEKSSVAALR